jgi:hypothetical protein
LSADVVIKPGFEILFTDTLPAPTVRATNVLANCRQQAMESLVSDPGSALESINQLASCVELEVARQFEDANVKVSFEEKVRISMAGFLENYTCADETLDSSPDVSSHFWTMPDATRMVHVKHDRAPSKIHVVENFISEDECLAMETEAALTLHSAAVADGKGGSQLSPNRKAMQAGITVQWDKEEEGDLIARLSRRVYDYTEHVLKLGINEHGQEDLMSIQYFGRGRNDTEPDRYTPVRLKRMPFVVHGVACVESGFMGARLNFFFFNLTLFLSVSSFFLLSFILQHCDGDCTGLPHKTGSRVATMVMYCKLPTDGGSTNFRNSAVHIKPVAGNAIFFSYIDPVSRTMDTGFTEHSGCPVFEGEKKIVTQWIRYGVDDENPWDSFNTLGIKISDADDQ